MTAYEMRISDWSSDVCSSDLEGARAIGALDPARGQFELALERAVVGEEQQPFGIIVESTDRHQARQALRQHVVDRLAPLGVAGGGQAAGGLVEAVETGRDGFGDRVSVDGRSEEHTSEIQSLMRISY